MLEPSTYSLVDDHEAETVVSDYRALEARAEAVARDLLPGARDANFQPGPGRRYAVSFDDEAPQMVNIHSDSSLALWARRVGEGVAVVSATHSLARPGAHVLKLWAVDGGLVFQKIVVDTGGLRPSHLGPPESPRRLVPAGAPLSRCSSGAGGQR